MANKVVAKKIEKGNGPLTEVFRIWAWVLLFWSLYRYFIHLPESVDEFIFKPLIFIGPVIYAVIRREKRSLSTLGITTDNLFPSIYLGLGIGFLFALEGLLANYLKYGALTINPITAFRQYGLFLLVISFATAISEELFGRGYLFSRIYEKSKGNIIYSSVLSTLMFLAMHVPILLTTLKFQGTTLVMFFLTSMVISLANAIIFRQTKSIVGPIIVHALWNMTVALYL